MRILVLDDHRLFLDGLRHVLIRLADNVDVTEAQATQRALEIVDASERFDLILADISMPGLDGLAFLAALRQRRVSTPVVIISGLSDTQVIRRALDEGALGFVPKSTPSTQLIEALRQVLAGDVYVPTELAEEIFSEIGDVGEPPSVSVAGIGDRQQEVLRLMAEGQSNKQIAIVLNITEATVKSHIGTLFKALGVKNRTACVREAAKRSLVKLAD